jgi:hypothetical protein
MKTTPNWRAKTITTADGLFVNVNDVKRALMDVDLLLECASMIRLAKEFNHPPLAGVRLCILCALAETTGQLLPQIMDLVIEDPPKIPPAPPEKKP